MSAEKKPSYLREMLTHQGNVYAGLGSLAAATMLSIPFGFGIGAIPLVVFAAGEIIAAMYVPASIAFRDRVDRQWRNRERVTTRDRLLTEIDARAKRTGLQQQTMNAYSRMASRVASLYSRADDAQSRLSVADVERLDDATIEYLYMWLASLVMEERGDAIKPTEIEGRISMLDKDIASPKAGADLRQLQKARADYVNILERHHRMQSRLRALDAAMLSMPDQLEEIYQTIMTTPLSEDVGTRLEESIAKLRLQEDIEAELDGDLATAVPGLAALPRQSASLSNNAIRSPRLAVVAGGRTQQSK
jgi:hypothetical protein